jgi:hypothetical protein
MYLFVVFECLPLVVFSTLDLLFSSLNVEEKVESLVYDIASFMATAGGNLSLLLGFSCLSVLIGVVSVAENKFFFRLINN